LLVVLVLVIVNAIELHSVDKVPGKPADQETDDESDYKSDDDVQHEILLC
jgi:hypothetical protein